MFMQIQILSVYHTCNEAKRGGGTEWVVGWVRHDALGRPSSVGMQKKKTKQKIHSNKYNQSTWRGRHMHLKVGAGGGWWGWVRCYGGLRQLATLNHLRMCACVLADHVC